MSERFCENSWMERELEDYEDMLNNTDYKPIEDDGDSIAETFSACLNNDSFNDPYLKQNNFCNNFQNTKSMYYNDDSVCDEAYILNNIDSCNDDIESEYYKELQEFEDQHNVKKTKTSNENRIIRNLKAINVDNNMMNSISRPKSYALLKNILTGKNTVSSTPFKLPSIKRIDEMSNLSFNSDLCDKPKDNLPVKNRYQLATKPVGLVNNNEIKGIVEKIELNQDHPNNMFLLNTEENNPKIHQVNPGLNNLQIENYIQLTSKPHTNQNSKKQKPITTYFTNTKTLAERHQKISDASDLSVSSKLIKHTKDYDQSPRKINFKGPISKKDYSNKYLPKATIPNVVRSEKLEMDMGLVDRRPSLTSLDQFDDKIDANKICFDIKSISKTGYQNKLTSELALKSLKTVKFERNLLDSSNTYGKNTDNMHKIPIKNLITDIYQSKESKNTKTYQKRSHHITNNPKQMFNNINKYFNNTMTTNSIIHKATIKRKGIKTPNFRIEDFPMLMSTTKLHSNIKHPKDKAIQTKNDHTHIGIIMSDKELMEKAIRYETMLADLKASNYKLSEKLSDVMNKNQHLTELLGSRGLVDLYKQTYKAVREYIECKVLREQAIYQISY